MVTYSFLPLLLLVVTCHLGCGGNPYKTINYKLPRVIRQNALQPTPVLRASVTITLPVDVADDINDDDTEEENVQDLNADPVETIITEVSEEPVIVEDVTSPAVITEAPPLQDEIITEAAPVVNQTVRLPCLCRKRQCGCCTGTFMEKYNMKACGNITFIPEDFVFDLNMNVNNQTVLRRRVSASDPPPVCFNPRRAPFVQVCARIYNIQIRNKNAHACFKVNADIGDFPVYSASFKCFNIGASGLQTSKKPRPVSSSGPKPVSLFSSSSSTSSSNDNKNEQDSGGFFENTIGSVFGDGGLFGGGSSSDDGDGAFDGLGEGLGDLFDFE